MENPEEQTGGQRAPMEPAQPGAQKPVLHIASAADARFLPGLGVALASALLASSGNYHYRFTVLDGGLGGDGRRRLSEILDAATRYTPTRHTLDFVEATHEVFESLPGRRGSNLTFARLAIPLLFPDEQVVYIDSDVLCLKGLEAFRQAALDRPCMLAAVRDPLGVCRRDRTLRGWMSGDDLEKPYFNAGIILLDGEAMNRAGFSEKIRELTQREARPRYVDQSYLNYLYCDDWSEVPNENNLILSMEQATDFSAHPRPANVHYVGSKKPWSPGQTSFYRYMPERLWQTFLPLLQGEPGVTTEIDAKHLGKARRKALFYRFWNPRRAAAYRRGLDAYSTGRADGVGALVQRLLADPTLSEGLKNYWNATSCPD